MKFIWKSFPRQRLTEHIQRAITDFIKRSYSIMVKSHPSMLFRTPTFTCCAFDLVLITVLRSTLLNLLMCLRVRKYFDGICGCYRLFNSFLVYLIVCMSDVTKQEWSILWVLRNMSINYDTLVDRSIYCNRKRFF